MRGCARLLNHFPGKIDAARMRKLNHAVDGEHRSVKDVAAEALKAIGSN